jgi:hypothetical protein
VGIVNNRFSLWKADRRTRRAGQGFIAGHMTHHMTTTATCARSSAMDPPEL